MSIWQRITREPVLIIGVVTGILGVLVLFGVPLTTEQIGGVVTLFGAVTAFLRFATTPTSEVAAQLKPGETIPQAGPAAPQDDGTYVVTTATAAPTEG